MYNNYDNNGVNNNTGMGNMESTNTTYVGGTPINIDSNVNATYDTTSNTGTTPSSNNTFINTNLSSSSAYTNNSTYDDNSHTNDLNSFVSYSGGYTSTNNQQNNSEGSFKVVTYFFGLIALIAGAVFLPGLFENSKTYTVTFMDVDGVYLVEERLPKNSTVNEPTRPTKKGYSFLGWYLDDVAYDFSTPIKDDLYLRAKWLNMNTNKVEEVSTEKVDSYKKTDSKKTQTTNTNTGTKTNNTKTNNNSGGGSGTQSPSTPATPIPNATPVPTPKPGAKSYTITLRNATFSDGTTYKKIAEGEQVNIYARINADYVDTKLYGKTSCKSSYDAGNISYKISHKYSIESWTSKSTSGTIQLDSKEKVLVFTVDKTATITATVKDERTEVDKQQCFEYNADVAGESYTCNEGDTLEGTRCVHITESTYNPGSSPKQCETNEVCGNGICNSDNYCYNRKETTYPPIGNPMRCLSDDDCPVMYGCNSTHYCAKVCTRNDECASSNCYLFCEGNNNLDLFQSATCNEGDYLSGQACIHTGIGTKMYVPSCRSGDTLRDSVCVHQTVSRYSARYTSGTYSCPQGGILSNKKCYITKPAN